ncbi:MAG: methyltransferase, S-adenosyl-L-methionine (SAM)-MTase protein [Amycolatopsis sp.]|uniref:hypothetical protein n=1 Tax=Amycolatopsis sp. TaxID=37632 RepID=UPI00261ED1FD|nr:hypothetical protein [Amycolatopsis sp.]MCU1683975.1 methyltransferase, S-adenosyl-L-methionine (SAM)-MTase protein [Amycolatopsis sp.]
MAVIRHFWDAAASLDPVASELDEACRFPICEPVVLQQLWTDAGLGEVTVRAIEVPTVFTDFDDYWTPFLDGQGPAPHYAMSLTDERRQALRELLRIRLPAGPDGSIALTARVWAVRGTAHHPVVLVGVPRLQPDAVAPGRSAATAAEPICALSAPGASPIGQHVLVAGAGPGLTIASPEIRFAATECRWW